MTLDNFTIKAQEAVQEAVNVARRAQHQGIEPIHLLLGIMAKGKDVTQFVFQKMGVSLQQITTLAQSELEHLPRVQGGEPISPMLPTRCWQRLRTRHRQWATPTWLSNRCSSH